MRQKKTWLNFVFKKVWQQVILQQLRSCHLYINSLSQINPSSSDQRTAFMTVFDCLIKYMHMWKEWSQRNDYGNRKNNYEIGWLWILYLFHQLSPGYLTSIGYHSLQNRIWLLFSIYVLLFGRFFKALSINWLIFNICCLYNNLFCSDLIQNTA